MAECHPVGFQWVMEAKRRGATIIHVDPRYTRTSAVSDIHVPLRAGTDIAFLGGLVNHVLTEGKEFRDYVVAYTNATTIINEDYGDPEDLDGLFSGWDPDKGQYDPSSWQYEGTEVAPSAGKKEMFAGAAEGARGKNVTERERDDTLEHPNCVFQILKRHFARYTPEMVADICGISEEQFLRVADALTSNSGRERTSAFCYAVGWTQHTVGVQYIRTASILQLLLGNIGRPGGGIMALRGHASIQGSTDIPTLYNLLPGYLPVPHAEHDITLGDYVSYNESDTGYWANFQSYIVSLLKAWFGDAATEDNDFCYDYLPHMSGDHSHMTTVAAMEDGSVEGYFLMGENPSVGSMHGALHRSAARKLKWCVVRDFQVTESAEFWRAGPEFDRGEVRPEDCDTEVFFLPAANHTEKDGAFTNTQRLLQWHHKAVEPPEDCRSELGFIFHLGQRLKALYADSVDAKDRPIQDLTWDYPTQGPHDEPDAEAVLAEINGYELDDGGNRQYLSKYTQMKPDGSTRVGCWIYVGAYADGVNQTARRKPWYEQNWIAPEWAWAWPDNRRIIYNRASADPEGKPWSDRKKYVWWDEDEESWQTLGDSMDFVPGRAPTYRPEEGAEGVDAIAGDSPFIMNADGKGWLFVPSGLLDGPLPTHYEPQESPVENLLYAQQCNPARVQWVRRDNPYHRAHSDPDFPYALTTYRLTEHHTAGGMSRWLSWLSELMPELFCEISPQLAAEKGIDNGGWVTVRTARGEIEARALVTPRIQPTRVGRKGNRRTVHTVGLPYHWSTHGLVTGDTVNELIGFVADPNVSIQESKALTCNIEAGRRSRGRRVVTSGPLVASRPDPDEDRDIEAVGHRPQGTHGERSGQTQQTEES